MSVKTAYTSHDAFNRKVNVPTSQAISLPKGYKHETIKVASQATPSWGGWVTFRITQKNISIDRILLEFQVSALTGLTVSASGNVGYLPTHLWAQRIDIFHGSTLIESIPAKANFLLHQLLVPHSEEKRTMRNLAAGNYASHSVRATKSSATDYWYLPLSSVWSQSSYPLIGEADLEIRVQLANLADSYSVTSGSTASGTAVSTFSGANAILIASHLPSSVVNYTRALLTKSPLHFGFQDVSSATYTVSSGVTSTNLVLSSITGFASCFFFVIRSSNPTNANQLTYNTTLTSFEVLSSGSTNIVGGQAILDLQNRLVQCGNWLNTTFTSEGAGAYFYSFALDPKEVWDTNGALSGYHFTGSEILKLNFSTSLASAVQVDFYALTYSAVEMGTSGVRKIALAE